MSKYDIQKIIDLCDGKISSREIENLTGIPRKYVQRCMKKLNLPRLKSGPPRDNKNPAWRFGRHYSRDGYVLVPAPENHPYARIAKNKKIGRILEHRLVMETFLGRYLLPGEVVHHKNGCTLDNRIENLELLSKNSEHLKKELKGCRPKWTPEGFAKMSLPCKTRKLFPKINNYNQRKKSGAVRRQQILLARELLGRDHPLLLGTELYLD